MASNHRTPRTVVALLAALLVAPLLAGAAGADAAPESGGAAEEGAPTILSLSVPRTADVFAPVRMLVVANDSAGGNLTVAWDLDHDGETFEADETGAEITHAFQRIGNVTVMVRVTNEDDKSAFLSAVVHVDDAVVLRLEVLEAPGDVLTSTFARASLTTWDGIPIPDAQLKLISFYLPGTGSAPTMREFTTTTGPDGTIEFFIPRDTAFANIPGAHLLRGDVKVGSGADLEAGFHTVRYTIQ